jgi:DNA/RNA-binding domain of Phe-tRNA-synthetase-like protein
MTDTKAMLDAAYVDPAVRALRPDYRALLVVADGLQGGPSDNTSEALLRQAEAHARELTGGGAIEELPHIAAWRDAYRAFGAKPQRARNSLEALTRRAIDGLPRVDWLTDVYNAISVLHQIPIGGEDLDHYDGPPHLIRALGSEDFDTSSNGEPVTEHPEPGEVVWTDGAGVTCRRWNWRQGHRTRLTDHTNRALFILDALAPMSDEQLDAVADALEEHLPRPDDSTRFARRRLADES